MRTPTPRVFAKSERRPTAHASPYIPALDAAFENELGSATSHTSGSQSPAEHHHPGGGLWTTKSNTGDEKSHKLSKFKFSLTATPPKSKPKQPGQPSVVSSPLSLFLSEMLFGVLECMCIIHSKRFMCFASASVAVVVRGISSESNLPLLFYQTALVIKRKVRFRFR